MIKIIKIGETIYQNIEPKSIFVNEETEEVVEQWNIPNDPETLKTCLQDTLAWIVGRKILKIVQDTNKKDASTSKAIVLLAKIQKGILDHLNLTLDDIGTFTDLEKSAFEKMQVLADIGYSDSELLNVAMEAVIGSLQWYVEKLEELEGKETLEELIEFAENEISL